jgi:hypothetical protein
MALETRGALGGATLPPELREKGRLELLIKDPQKWFPDSENRQKSFRYTAFQRITSTLSVVRPSRDWIEPSFAPETAESSDLSRSRPSQQPSKLAQHFGVLARVTPSDIFRRLPFRQVGKPDRAESVRAGIVISIGHAWQCQVSKSREYELRE